MNQQIQLIFKLEKICYQYTGRRIFDDERKNLQLMIEGLEDWQAEQVLIFVEEALNDVRDVRYLQKTKTTPAASLSTASLIQEPSAGEVFPEDDPISYFQMQVWRWMHDDYRKRREAPEKEKNFCQNKKLDLQADNTQQKGNEKPVSQRGRNERKYF